MNTPITLNLSACEISRLRDIVNDKQDVLFDRLVAVEAIAGKASSPSDLNAAKGRAEGLRVTLRFWDGIERQLAAANQRAINAEVEQPAVN